MLSSLADQDCHVRPLVQGLKVLYQPSQYLFVIVYVTECRVTTRTEKSAYLPSSMVMVHLKALPVVFDIPVVRLAALLVCAATRLGFP